MKKFLLITIVAFISATKSMAQTVSLSPTPVTVSAGNSATLTASASSFPNGSKTYAWSSSPSAGVTIASGGSSSKSITFSTVGTYIITASVTAGSTTVSANDTVNVVAGSIRTYGSPVYSANIQGGHVMIGNTVLAQYSGSSINTTAMNYFNIASNGTTSTYGNDNSNMQYVNIDGSSSTLYNATSATLNLPTGTNTIKYARLYWGGHLSGSDFTSSNLTTVKIRFGSGGYQNVTIPATQVTAFPFSTSSSTMIYQSYADITSFLQGKGSGTYTVGNVPASVGSLSDGGAYGGWTIVVAYENTLMPYYSVRIYDAFMKIAQNSSAQTVTLTNLNAPNNTLLSSDAYLSTFAWEGDANLAASSGNAAGDYLQINGTTYSDAVNPATNMWNGTISNNGSFVTTTNPSFKNQMGIDIDQINVGTGYGINPNATSVNVTFGTEQDQYYPSCFAFSIRMKDPLVTISKTVSGSLYPNNAVLPNDTLTYVISGQNTGLGDLSNAVVVDSLPAGITYVPNSMQMLSSSSMLAMTDAANDDNAVVAVAPNGRTYITFYVGTGATATSGGVLGAGSTYQVKFKAITPATANQLVTVSNTAYISGTGSQTGTLSTTLTNQSTVIISPINSLPISLLSFTATKSGNDALIRWSTSSELNNDYMEVERSTDGINFIKVSSIAGNGTTSIVHSYQYNDPINGLSGIVYYRLLSVDNYGKMTYSQIIPLRLDGSATSSSFSVYPNPFASDIKLNVTSTKQTTGNVVINNIAGQQVLAQPVTIQDGENVIVINNLGSLRPGIYIISYITEDGRITQKIVKN